jgi:PRTRC genetic system ThiF family protein
MAMYAHQLGNNHLSVLQRTEVMSNNRLDMNAVNARRLLIPMAPRSLHVYLIGCGGTGSWLAPHLARYLRLFKEVNPDTDLQLFFVDRDWVEEKNTFRQNFIPAEIGQNKAEALAMRYTISAGLPITACADNFDKIRGTRAADSEGMTLYLGCVDNAAARRSIARQMNYHKYSPGNAFWLDCGNHKYSGQVLLSKDGDNSVSPFTLKGACTYIPTQDQFHPELFRDEKEKKVKVSARISCAEQAMIDQQSLSINTTVASVAAHYLAGLLLTGKVEKFATYFDLENNLPFNHRYLVPEEFGEYDAKKKRK